MSRSSAWYLTGLFTASVAFCVVGCSDSAPTVPTITGIELAKGGVIKDPTVREAVPDSGFQGESLEVKVVGSGFDDGSDVRLYVTGDATTSEITTLETTFVSARELRARIRIADDADLLIYDVEVRTSRDKKGIGSEMFRVREKVNNGGQLEWPTAEQLVVEVLPLGETHGLTDVPEVDAAIASAEEQSSFFGCPDPERTCNAIKLTFMGEADEIHFKVQPSVQGCLDGLVEVEGGCVYDMDLEDRYNAASWYQTGTPSVPLAGLVGSNALTLNPDGSKTFRIYWQGQRGQWSIDDGPYVRYIWSRYPDLDYPALDYPRGHDHYVFFTAVYLGTESRFMTGVNYTDCTERNACWAEYEGAVSGQQAYVVWDDFRLIGGKGRYKDRDPDYVAFSIRTFRDDLSKTAPDYSDPDVVASNVRAWHTVMLTDWTGGKSILKSRSAGTNSDGVYGNGYSLPITGSGCYELRLLESFVHDENALGYVWYSQADPTAMFVRVDYQEGGTAKWTPGQRCGAASP